MLDWLRLALMVLRAACRSRTNLVLENLLLRHQLAVLARPNRRRRVRFRRLDKLLWVRIRRVRRDWRQHQVVVTPDTVVRWHRAGWRLCWRWTSRGPMGRPRLSPEIRGLIARMSGENPLRGSERIRGGLLTLGRVVSNRSSDGGEMWEPCGAGLRFDALHPLFCAAYGKAHELPGQRPALIVLASGGLLCAYRDMTEGRPGVACAVSADAGQTWVTLGQLYAGGGRDCAYPSLGRLSGDRLHCAFYTSASPSRSGASEIHGLVLADRSASS